MATTANRLALGTPAPSFSLTDTVSGKTIHKTDFTGKPLLVAFICNHCPYVKHISSAFSALASEYLAKGVGVVGICSNDQTIHPDDGPGPMKAEALSAGYRFPYCHDADQSVAKAFRAACTPDLFLFDRQHRLAYHGQFDGSRPKPGNTVAVNGADLRSAIDAVLAGKAPLAEQQPSIGCNIKWTPGKEPDYAR